MFCIFFLGGSPTGPTPIIKKRGALISGMLPWWLEDVSSCGARIHVFLRNKKPSFLVSRQHVCSCVTTKHFSAATKKLVSLLHHPPHDMSSCGARAHVFLCHTEGAEFSRIFLFFCQKNTCLLVPQENVSSRSTRKPAFV